MFTKRQLALLFLTVLLISVSLLALPQGSRAGNPEDENTAVCLEITTLFRSARAVISKNQALINDASKGDKGLTGEVVVAAAREVFEETTGSPLPESDPADAASLRNNARVAMLASIEEVMQENQRWINEQGKGFKGFLPAVFAKMVADRFSEKMNGQMFIRLTAPKDYVRNRANRPDTWEAEVIEKQFRSASHEKGKEVHAQAEYRGKTAFRLMIPEYYKESCLKCHGDPKGETDITGGKKEGGKLGQLGGAISVGIFQ